MRTFTYLPGILCMSGMFLHIILSGPALDSFGFHYSGEEGSFFEKIHPGTYFIFASFAALLVMQRPVLARVFLLILAEPAFSALLFLYIMLFVYLVLRSGPGGLAFIIDTHMTAPICALVLSSIPLAQCRKILHGFLLLACANSVIGMAEAFGRFRIFNFDPNWNVMLEPYFRASALLGHPLTNAMFTVTALFIALSQPYPRWLKACLILLFMSALIPFGGRAALAYAVLGLALAGSTTCIRPLWSKHISLYHTFLLLGVTMLAPALLSGGIYLLINSGLGERLASTSLSDDSAASRELALTVMDYMSVSELWLGVSPARIQDIAYRVNLKVALSYIENPWLLMFMMFGLVGFTLWLAALLCFIARLIRAQPLPLKLAVLGYFLIASTSNSFGRKDSNFLILAGISVCAGRISHMPKKSS